MKFHSIIGIAVVCLLECGCVYHYRAAVSFTPQIINSSLQEVKLSSTVPGAASLVVTRITIDKSLDQFVDESARAVGFSSGSLLSLAVVPTGKKGEKEIVSVVVEVVPRNGERMRLSGSFTIIGGFIRQMRQMQGLTEDSTGVQVTPQGGSFREFAVSDAAVVRDSIVEAIRRALEKKPNQSPAPTAETGRGSS